MSRAKVGRDHESVSRDGLAAVAEWEAEHGALSEAELDAARKRVFGARRRKARRASTLSRYEWTKAKRGKHLERARRSFDTLVVDKKLLETLGGSEAAVEILRAVANAIKGSRKKRQAS